MSTPLRMIIVGSRPPQWFEGCLKVNRELRLVSQAEIREHFYGPNSVIPAGEWHEIVDLPFENVESIDKLKLCHDAVYHFACDDGLLAFTQS